MPAVQMPVPICLNPNVLLAAIPVLVRAQLQLHINVHNCCHLRGKKKKKNLAFLQMLAALGSCGTGHRNEGYC